MTSISNLPSNNILETLVAPITLHDIAIKVFTIALYYAPSTYNAPLKLGQYMNKNTVPIKEIKLE